MPFIADDQAPEVAEPGEEPLDLPATAGAPQRVSILRLGPHAPPAVGSDHLDAQLGQGPIQSIRIVGTIPDEPLGQVVDEARDIVSPTIWTGADVKMAGRRIAKRG
jgi:hypothetical protein